MQYKSEIKSLEKNAETRLLIGNSYSDAAALRVLVARLFPLAQSVAIW